MKTYHDKVTDVPKTCHNCGEKKAFVTILADYPDRDTGYRDELNLCDECLNELLNKVERG